MKIIILLAIIGILLIPSAVQADETLLTMPGGKVNTHLAMPKPEQTCHNWQENGWIVEASYYPIYTDYLSDFGHYFTQYPNTCKVQAEAE